ncbi:MAG: recombinase family protein [Phycisphaerae bacterium]
MKQTAAIYARYSSHAQDGGTSIDVQVETCRRALSGQNVQEYVDRARTGRSMAGREALLRLLTDAEAGQFAQLYVYKYDRLGRNLAETSAIIAQLEDCGVEVVSVTEGKDQLARGVQLVVAEHYSRALAERTRDGLLQRFKEHAWTGGPAPYGYESVDDNGTKRLRISETEAAIIRGIFADYLGGKGFKAITQGLHRRGVPTRRGGPWVFSSVRAIVKNDVYTGTVRYNRRQFKLSRKTGRRVPQWRDDAEVESFHDENLRIISDRDWAEVKRRLEERARPGGRPHSSATIRPFTGLLFCENGHRCYIRRSKNAKGDYYYYACGIRQRAVRDACDNMAVVREDKGSSSAQESLGMLGLTIKDLNGLSPDEQFKRIADRLNQIEDPTIRAAMAMEIFGKNGTAMLPMITAGAAGIDDLCKRARALGLTISTEDAEAAHGFNRALEVLWKVLKQSVFVIGSALAPTLKELAGWITGVVRASAWIKQNKDLVLTVFKVAAAVLVGGLALVGLGYVISGLGAVFGTLATIISGVGTVLGIVGSIIAWLLSPIGMVIAAVVALGGYILYATGMAGKALGWLGERWNELKADAMEAYQGIADALAAGDIGLAAKILWLTLKMEWQKGVNWISSIWNGALLWLRQRATEAFYGLVMGLEYIWHGLEVAWIETTAFLSSVWTNFCAGIHHAWLWVAKSLEETWNKVKGVFDKSFDPDAANKAVEEQYGKARDAMWNEAKKQLGERDAQRARERDEAAKTHEATLNELVQQGEAKKKEYQDEYDQKMKSNQDELDNARKEWKDAIDQAKQKRKDKDAKGPDKMEGPEDLMKKLRGQLGGLDDLAKRTIGVKGTFNAAEAPGLGAGGPSDRIANATEETAKNTRKLVDKAGNGLAFQ